MKKYLKKLSNETQGIIRLAADTARKNNLRVYLVGGFVRDLILNVGNSDLDIVVEGDGIKFAEELSAILGLKLTRHKKFGTATIDLGEHLKVDIASARSEIYPYPASLPVVKAGTLKEDLFRRDFSINAMAISINPSDFGTLIDYFSGKHDLADRKIRVLHDLSFIDDPTRILRGIRFEQRYDFKIEPHTLSLLKDAVKQESLSQVSPHRIRDELILIFKEKDPVKEIRRISRLTGFAFIHKKISVSLKTYSLLNFARQEINWFNETYPRHRRLDIWLIYFMALLDKLSLKEVLGACKKFALKKGEEIRILSFKNAESRLYVSLNKKRLLASEIFYMLEPLSYEVIILLLAKYKTSKLLKNIKVFFDALNGARIFTSGHDLRRLGLTPGPAYQELFAKVLEAKLNGKVSTKTEELELIRKLVKQKKAE
ncbi:MAG: CCA tRNA nucleotidyltransferase [Candidatus Omnitrophota bacterium]|jgi:tRNA nucleotidyltransferase (CCA-adding enzyme)